MPTKAKKTTSKKTSKKACHVHPAFDFKPSTRLTRIGQRNKKGPKQKLLELVPRKGSITLAKLTTLAKAQELPAKKVEGWVRFLRSYDHLRVTEEV